MRVFMIPMYNLEILIRIFSDEELYKFQYLRKRIETEIVTVEMICKWCIAQGIQYNMRFRYYRFEKHSINYNIYFWIKYQLLKKELKNIKRYTSRLIQ